jgi:hypothetical protein
MHLAQRVPLLLELAIPSIVRLRDQEYGMGSIVFVRRHRHILTDAYRNHPDLFCHAIVFDFGPQIFRRRQISPILSFHCSSFPPAFSPLQSTIERARAGSCTTDAHFCARRHLQSIGMDRFSALSADAILASFRAGQGLFDLIGSLSALFQQCQINLPTCGCRISLAGAIVRPILQGQLQLGDLISQLVWFFL